MNSICQNLICPCGSNRKFAACCEPLISGKHWAFDAEQLMRSRFTAFKTQHYGYLCDTHYVDSNKTKPIIDDFDRNILWVGLLIIEHKADIDFVSKSQVEFVAFYHSVEDSTILQLHERSNFLKVNDRWLYVDGTHLPGIKIQRNTPCFCLSGKKYKNCHGQ